MIFVSVMSTYSNNFGLNDCYEYAEYSFDSGNATVPAVSSSPIRDWPQFIFGRVLKDIAAIKVLEVQIPFSWYVFNTNNNYFNLIESGISTDPGVVVTVPVGNYTATTLATALALALTAASPGLYTYTVTYSATTGKFTFTNNNPGVSDVFLFASVPSPMNADMRNYLGFGGLLPFSSASPNSTLSSTGPANVTGPNYLFVNSNTLGTVIQLYLPAGVNTSGNMGPELAHVPINTNPGGVIFWQDPDPQKWFDVGSLNNLDRIDLFLTLGQTANPQKPLPLNGQSFSIKLGVLSNRRTMDQLMGGGANKGRVERRNVGM